MIIDSGSIKKMQVKSEDNIILLDKPVDWSSFDVVKKIRSLTRIKKIGHSGTLDPFASGLLILGTGSKTKHLTDISNAAKSYVATVQFGKTTDTYDVTGKITSENALDGFDKINFEQILESFLGEGQQIPPMYSAKKIDGKRLYKMARRGIVVERKPQSIVIHEIKQLERQSDLLTFFINCSKGTYIRSLAHDIGTVSGFGAYLRNLRRVAINNFKIEKALTVEEFSHYWRSLN